MATAAILDIKSHPNIYDVLVWKQSNWVVTDTDGRKRNFAFIWLHMVHTIACVMLKQHFFEIKIKTQNFKNKHIFIPER